MNVHVVCRETDNWILSRLAKVLTAGLGWSMSPQPSQDVDVNYYVPYLLVDKKAPTKAAGFFTHLEESEQAKGKADRWHRAAKEMDLRVAMCEKYRLQLAKYGPAVAPLIPVDLRKFVPRRLRVGVAGQVYALSRKGEKLVERLVKEPEFEVVGAGKGWPCPTTFYPWAKMQEFYQTLDVFLITSEVEGGPVTLLEALACGVPVVAPRGVGFVDEFEVITYPRGDYGAMLARLRALVRGRLRRRGLVRDRAEAAFAQAHVAAFERYLA